MPATHNTLTSAEVLVIGAGPSGLATSQCLLNSGIEVAVVDRSGKPGGAYRRTQPSLTLSSPTRFLSLPGLPIGSPASYLKAQNYTSYLSAYADQHHINVLPHDVIDVQPGYDSVAVTFAGGRRIEFPAVVVATGMCDYPVLPLIQGLHKEVSRIRTIHARDWNTDFSASKPKIAIVGNGMRSVEIAEECATTCKVTVSAHKAQVRTWPRKIAGFDFRHITFPLMRYTPPFLVGKRCTSSWRFKPIDRGFKSFLKKGAITLRPRISHVEDEVLHFVDGSCTEADLLVFATGYKFALPFLSRAPDARSGFISV